MKEGNRGYSPYFNTNQDRDIRLSEQLHKPYSEGVLQSREAEQREVVRRTFEQYLDSKWETRDTNEKQDAWNRMQRTVNRLEQRHPDIFDEVIQSRGEEWARDHIVRDYEHAYSDMRRQRESGERMKRPIADYRSRVRKDHRRFDSVFPNVYDAAFEKLAALQGRRQSSQPEEWNNQ